MKLNNVVSLEDYFMLVCVVWQHWEKFSKIKWQWKNKKDNIIIINEIFL